MGWEIVTVEVAVVPEPVVVQPTCTVPAMLRAAGVEPQLPRTIWAVLFVVRPVLMKPPPLVVAVQLTGEADRQEELS